MGKPWDVVLLSCMHNQEASQPVRGGEQFCRRCADFVTIISEPVTHAVRCGTCTFSRRFGADFSTAKRVAGRHLNKHASHKVYVTDGTTHTTLTGIQPTLTGLLETSKRVQAALRQHDM
jgi:hypothetical protein